MQIEVNEQFRFASVWLTNDEQETLDILGSLKPLIDKYKEMKYRFVIFQSGTQNLLELTQGLLAHNKNIGRNNISDRLDDMPGEKTSVKKKLVALKSQAGNAPGKVDVEKAKNTEEVL